MRNLRMVLLLVVGVLILSMANTTYSTTITFFGEVDSGDFIGMSGSGSITYDEDLGSNGPGGRLYDELNDGLSILFMFDNEQFDQASFDGTFSISVSNDLLTDAQYKLEADVAGVEFGTEGLVSIDFGSPISSYGGYDYYIPLSANVSTGGVSTELQTEPNPHPGSTPVPEPATMLLFGTGFTGLAVVCRKRKK